MLTEPSKEFSAGTTATSVSFLWHTSTQEIEGKPPFPVIQI